MENWKHVKTRKIEKWEDGNLKNEKMADSIAKMHPLKRVGEGSDSSSVANFLLSDNSSWITGQILGVDGGRSSLT